MSTEIFDLALNEDRDISFDAGDVVFITKQSESLRQRIDVLLRTWMGEWALDIEHGVPYRQSIFTKVKSKKDLDAIFIALINDVDGVESINEFDSTFDSGIRNYAINAIEVSTTESEILVFSNIVPDDFIYPETVNTTMKLCDLA